MKPINLSKLSLIFTLLISIVPTSHAGNDSGNGGGGIVCLNANGKSSVELLDLVEAAKNPRLTIQRSSTPWPQQLENALQKYAAVHQDYVTLMREELASMDKNTVKLAADKRLPPPSDTQITELNEPRNCFIEGVANYNDLQGKLYLDTKLENLMSETDRAALRFHEAWYRVQRTKMTPTNNSKIAREVTGHVFASEPLVFTPAHIGIKNAISECISEDQNYIFYVIPQNNFTSSELLFTRIKGLDIGERTSILVSSNKKVPGQIKVNGDIMDSLTEGFIETSRDALKAERADGTAGTVHLQAKSIAVTVKTKYGASLNILLTTSDWASNRSKEHLDNILRYGYQQTDWAIGWALKNATVYENVSNYIALQVAGANLSRYSKGKNEYNSRFVCRALL